MHNCCDIATTRTSKCTSNNHCLKNRYFLISLLKYHNYKNSVIHYDSKITENKFKKKIGIKEVVRIIKQIITIVVIILIVLIVVEMQRGK